MVQQTADNDRLRIFASNVAVVILDGILESLTHHKRVARHNGSLATIEHQLCAQSIRRPVDTRRIELNRFFTMDIGEVVIALKALMVYRFGEHHQQGIRLLAVAQRSACNDRGHLVDQGSRFFVHECFVKDLVIGINVCLRQVVADARNAFRQTGRRHHFPNHPGRIIRVKLQVSRLRLQLDHHTAIAVPRERHIERTIDIRLGQLSVEHGHDPIQDAISVGIPVFHVLGRREAFHHLDSHFAFVFVGGNIRQTLKGHARIERHTILERALQLEGLADQDYNILRGHIDLKHFVQPIPSPFLLEHHKHVGRININRHQVNIELQEQRVKAVRVTDSISVLNHVAAHFRHRSLAEISRPRSSLISVSDQRLGILRELTHARQIQSAHIYLNSVTLDCRVDTVIGLSANDKLDSIQVIAIGQGILQENFQVVKRHVIIGILDVAHAAIRNRVVEVDVVDNNHLSSAVHLDGTAIDHLVGRHENRDAAIDIHDQFVGDFAVARINQFYILTRHQRQGIRRTEIFLHLIRIQRNGDNVTDLSRIQARIKA